MSNMRNSRADFDIHELSLEKLAIFDNSTNKVDPFLLPPSFVDPQGGNGFCLPLACSDVYNHRRRLFELTCKSEEAEYVDHIFGDSYSVNQLIAQNCTDIKSLLERIASQGVTTSHHYDAAPIHPNTASKDLKGCRILRIGKCKAFEKSSTGLTTWAKEIEKELFAFGPVVSGFLCRVDCGRMAEDFLYRPNTKMDWMYADKAKQLVMAHAVMVVGVGVARCKLTDIVIDYFVFQNYWGNLGNSIGRMPIEEFMNAYAPVIKGQSDFSEYLKDPGEQAKAKGRRCVLGWRP